MPRKKIKIMVSSAVYGFEKDLRQICATIEGYKTPKYEYEVLNSNIGSIYIYASFGLSDRLLLNTIFKHDNCAKIELHYYHEDSNDNFDELTMKLSRHFDSHIKDKMRKIVVRYSNSIPMD